MKIFGLLAVAVTCLLPISHAPAAEPQLSLTVNSAAVSSTFTVYVGGGANISPPPTAGGGGGVPVLSFSNNGPAFMAGEISSKDSKTTLVRLTFTIRNTSPSAASFKIGDVSLTVGSEKWNDFAAVGYDSQLCAMDNDDRKKVKEIIVTIPAGQSKTLSYIFPRFSTETNHAELHLNDSLSTSFNISKN